jgi:hypothetical protein
MGEPANDGVWRVFSVTFESASALATLDGAPSYVALTQTLGAEGLLGISVGARMSGTTAGEFSPLKLGEMLVCAGRLTVDEIDAVNAYLCAKWTRRARSAGGYGQFDQVTQPNGQAARIWQPQTAKNTAVIICHEHTGTGQYAPPAAMYPVVAALQAAGYTVAASNMGGDCWGNAAGQASVVDLWGMLKSANPGLTRLVLVALSMGGAAALNLAIAGTIPELRGVYGIDAVCSLAAMYAGNTGGYAASIRTAYGVATDGSDYSAKTTGFDPMLTTVPAPALAERYRFASSTADTAVVAASHADAMAPRLAGAVEVSALKHTGAHLAGVGMRPHDVLAFVERCAV